MVTGIRKDDESVLDILGNNYQYDQLQRIRDMKSYYASGLNAANSFAGAALYREGAYRSEYTFDKNGNLLALKRNGSAVDDLGGTVPLPMDDFSYNYENGSGGTITPPTERNRLSYVRDAAANDANYQGDIKSGQAAGNYVYNLNGQLTADVQEGIEKIEWTVTGKVKTIKFTTAAKGNGKLDLKFIYDPMDRRVVKMVYNNDAHSGITYTYYSYDASGNPLAVYDRSTIQLLTPSNPRTFSDKYWIAEQTIYGSSRLGIMNPDEQIVNATITQPPANSSNLETGTGFTWTGTTPVAFDHSYRKVMLKRYELSNHLGNVLAVITDRKLEFGTTNTYIADVVQYSDYEPYGSQLQHRHYEGAGYRYGFQGQEMDDEIKGEGKSLNYEYRMHDPRIGRFFAVDPLASIYAHNSPYAFSQNIVINSIELEGLENIYVYAWNPQKEKWVKKYTAKDANLHVNVNKYVVFGSNGKPSEITYQVVHDARYYTQLYVQKSNQWQLDFAKWNKEYNQKGWDNATPEQKEISLRTQAVLGPLKEYAMEEMAPVGEMFKIQALLGGSGMATGLKTVGTSIVGETITTAVEEGLVIEKEVAIATKFEIDATFITGVDNLAGRVDVGWYTGNTLYIGIDAILKTPGAPKGSAFTRRLS